MLGSFSTRLPILILRMRLSVLEFAGKNADKVPERTNFRRLALAVSCRYTRHCGPIKEWCLVIDAVLYIDMYLMTSYYCIILLYPSFF